MLGGAELTLLRLANALKTHEITVYRIQRSKADQKLLQQFTNVTIKYPTRFTDFILRKIDRIFYRLNLDFSLSSFLIQYEIRSLITKEGFDIVHSHLFKTDLLVALALRGLEIPMAITVHGDYLNFFQSTKVLNYKEKLNQILKRVNGIICISDKQLNFFRAQLSSGSDIKLVKIYNGFEYNKEIPSKNNSPFVFGMVARGIPEKGWQICIDAFLTLKHPNLSLILVGQSDYIKALKEKYCSHSTIQFVGYSDDPIQWISKFHVGLLLTTYASESLPTSIIEYLYSGIPVIASDAGEIPIMIKSSSGVAGTILSKSQLNYKEVAKAMELYVKNPLLYNTHSLEAKKAFGKFEMQKTIQELESFYRQLQIQK